MSPDATRLIIKSITYGIMHICGAVSVAYVMTGNIYIALGVGLVEPIVQIFIFAFHESLWEHKNFWQTVRNAIRSGLH